MTFKNLVFQREDKDFASLLKGGTEFIIANDKIFSLVYTDGETHSTSTPGASANALVKQFCGQTADKNEIRLANGSSSQGRVKPAERLIGLLYTVHGAVRLRNHANN